jgi:general secretion pathway protein C
LKKIFSFILKMVMRFSMVVNLLLLTAAAFWGVKIFYNITTAGIDYVNMPEATRENKATFKKEIYHPLSYYNTIVERDLFKTKTNKYEMPVRIETLEHTDLDLNLWGTVECNIGKSYAIIEEIKRTRRQREQKIYSVGDSVQNATIKKILREKVILSVNGKAEILKLVKHHSSRGVRKYLVRPIRKKRILSRTKIKKAVKNVNAILSQARIRSHSEGLKITRIKPNSIFRQMGLRSGDIITGVDGKRIRSVDDAFNLYRNLQSSSNVTLELKRSGRPITMNYTIR